jgi:hypothetical protein
MLQLMNNNNSRKKLSLNKETLRVLSSAELQEATGGAEAITYSLSLGDRCQKSNEMSGGGYTCRCAAE